MNQAIKQIDKMLADAAKKKTTVSDLESHAKRVYELGDLTPLQHEFYRGVLRAFELLRECDLLKE